MDCIKAFLIILLLLTTITLFSQSTITNDTNDKVIPLDFFNFTLELKNDVGAASGFAYKDSSGRSFIITARHFFEKKYKHVDEKGQVKLYDSVPYKNGDFISMQLFLTGWQKVFIPIYFLSDSIDLAILKLPDNSLPVNVFNIDVGAGYLSQDVFMIGYGLGLSSRNYKDSQVFVHPMPLVNKGIFSGATKNEIFISASNTYGYSGGPVVYYDYVRKKWELSGVISGYLNQTN